MSRLRTGLIVLALAVPTVWVYATSLDKAPVYMASDEIKFGLQAHALASKGTDVTGQRLPLFFSEPDFVSGRDPISIYATALLLKMRPFSESTLRLPTVLVGVLNVVVMFFLARRIFRRDSLAIAAAALLAVAPLHFIYSRFALDVVYPLPFLMVWLLCLVAYLDGGGLARLFAATLLLGLGVYSYLAFLVMSPVYLLMTGAMVVSSRRGPGDGGRTLGTSLGGGVRPLLASAAGFALAMVPLVVWHLRHPSRYADLVREYHLYDSTRLNALQGAKNLSSYFSLSVRSAIYWDFFNPSLLFFSGDASLMNSTRRAGVFLWPMAVLMLIGAYRMLCIRRTPLTPLLLLGFVTAPIAGVLLPEVQIRRALVMLPFAVLIATYGVEHLVTSPRAIWRLVGIAAVPFVVLLFKPFYLDYLGDNRFRSGIWFGGNLRGALEKVVERETTATRTVYLDERIGYIEAYWAFYAIKHGREDLLPRTVYYDPMTIAPETMPSSSVMVSRVPDPAIDALVASGALRRIDVVRELDDTPSFQLLEK